MRNLFSAVILAAGLIFAVCNWADAEESITPPRTKTVALDPKLLPPPCPGDVCIIRQSQGGYTHKFIELAQEIKAKNKRLEIRGACVSACTILADLARPNVCVSESVVIAIHQGKIVPKEGEEAKRIPLEYSDDLDVWIANKGGQPTHGFILMFYDEAKEYWPTCNMLQSKTQETGLTR